MIQSIVKANEVLEKVRSSTFKHIHVFEWASSLKIIYKFSDISVQIFVLKFNLKRDLQGICI